MVNPGFSTPTHTPLSAYPLAYPLPTTRFLCETWWTGWTTPQRRHSWRARSDSLLATEEPLSVILPLIRDSIDLVWTPEPRWTAAVPNWRGISCQIGRAQLWLPVEETLLLRPFALLALLPERDPPEWHPYVLLGAQFLQEYRVTVALDCSQSPGQHRLSIP